MVDTDRAVSPKDAPVQVLIVGGGPAGLSAGLYAARSGLRTRLIEMALPGGQIASSDQVENYPGVRPMQGYDFGDLLRDHAASFGCEIVYDEVASIAHADDGWFDVSSGSGDSSRVPAVIFATGTAPRPAGFSGEEAFTGRGVSYCATCDARLYTGKEVYVVGGGTSACEEAAFLSRFASKVTMLVRRDRLGTVVSVQKRIEQLPNLVINYHTEIVGVAGDRAIGSMVLRDTRDNTRTELSFGEGTRGIFVFAGHEPRSILLEGLADRGHDGAVITDNRMRTRTPGLFAAGDVRNTALRQVVTAAADGAVAAVEAYAYLERLQLLS